jgi:ABC-type lipoprotein export system ATPase subunit
MEEEFKINPNRIALLIIGMAGSGKTTLVNVNNIPLSELVIEFILKQSRKETLYRESRSSCLFRSLLA